MPRTITFSSTYPYSASTISSPTRRPVVPVRLFNARDDSQSLDLSMLVDSGADTTCLPLDIATLLDIDVSSLQARIMRGVSGAASTYRHEGILMSLANTLVRCPVHFVPGLSVSLLGREGVFDEFIFGFEQRVSDVHVGVTFPSP